MTNAMREFLNALRAAGSPDWTGTDAERSCLVNAAAQFIEEDQAALAQFRKERDGWVNKLETFMARAEISRRPDLRVN